MIVGLVPTYREGPLAKGAINSLLKCCDVVVVFEGPLEGVPETGEKTDLIAFRKNPHVIIKHGSWGTEADKRNAMLEFTRRYPKPTWGVYLDADEILLDGEYLPDLIWAAGHHSPNGQDTAAFPLLIQEVDASVAKGHRVFRLDLLERHVLSMSQWKFFSSDIVVTFPTMHVWRPGEPITVDDNEQRRPPMQGEPHIHHRAYYRQQTRGETRLHQRETDDYLELERAHMERLGANSKLLVMQVDTDRVRREL